MKLIVDPINNVIELKVRTTDKEDKFFYLPTKNVHYWYPFNVNFHYKYSNSKQMLYLVKEKDYKGENFYKVDILKRTKPLGERNGIMFHPHVYMRNRYIIDRARAVGLPTIKDLYTIEDVESGFSELGYMIDIVKEKSEKRLLDSTDTNEITIPEMYSEEWDKKIFANMTEDEQRVLIEFGEMYSMLTVMRKLSEGG